MAKISVKLGIDGEAEYRRALNNSIQTAKTLDKQMQELESSFDDQTDAMEANAKQHELLQQKAEVLSQEVEQMQQMVDAAAEKFGENSTECQKWEASLAEAQTELNNVNAEIALNEEAAENMNSALGQLTSEIESQTTELDELRDQYINAVLEFGDTSDEAETLAEQIQELSGSLEDNKAKLEDATNAADGLIESGDSLAGSLDDVSESENEVGAAALSMGGQFIPQFGLMEAAITGAGIGGLLSEIVDFAVDIGTQIYEASVEWEESMGAMQVATGLTGDALRDLHEQAVNLYKDFNDADVTLTDTTNLYSMLNTRLGVTGDNADALAERFLMFSSVLGVDTVESINDTIDTMKQYGLVTDDTNANYETAAALLDALMQAQSDADVNVMELNSTLGDQAGAFQSLGLTWQDALGYMDAYRDAGGNVSTISKAMEKAVSALGGKTNDLQGAWNEAVKIMSESDDVFETLGTEIGDTGVTIEEAFGKKNAQAIINTMSNGKLNVDRFTESINNSKGKVEEYFDGNRTKADEFSTVNKHMMEEWVNYGSDMNSAYVVLGDTVVKYFDILTGKTKASKDDVVEASDVTQKGISNAFETANKNATGSISSMGASIVSDIESIRRIASDPIRFGIEAPTITYKKSGSGANATLTPEVSYHSYAAAYDRAMILSSPTIFGAQGGELLVGGDGAGNEVVVGEQHLLSLMGEAVRTNTTNNADITINVYGAEGQSVQELAEAVNEQLQAALDRSVAAYG